MIFDWTPGERISKLPKLLWWPALVWRNIYFLPGNVKRHFQQRESFAAQAIRGSLSLSVEYVHGANVGGDVAEFGTMTGKTATALARAVAQYDGSKRLLLFDSFEGLPATQSVIDASSPHVRSGTWTGGTCRGVTSQQLRAMCRKHLPDRQIEIYEGWFANTLPKLSADTRIALLHIDSDLYQSAIDVLNHCFSRHMVSRGAAIHFDDWDCNQADPRYGERKAWAEIVEQFAVEFTDCGQYGWGARKFIVHSYRGMETNDS
jgi:hypothetical protein